MFLVILSIPTVFLTVWNSSKLLKKYQLIRRVPATYERNIPEEFLTEWNAINTDINYVSLISDEIDRLNNLSSPIFHTLLAVILLGILSIVPGFDNQIFPLILGLIVVGIITVIFGHVVRVRYHIEYEGVIDNMSNDEEGINKKMYV